MAYSSIVLYVCMCNAHLGAGLFFALILQTLMNNLSVYALSVYSTQQYPSSKVPEPGCARVCVCVLNERTSRKKACQDQAKLSKSMLNERTGRKKARQDQSQAIHTQHTHTDTHTQRVCVGVVVLLGRVLINRTKEPGVCVVTHTHAHTQTSRHNTQVAN